MAKEKKKEKKPPSTFTSKALNPAEKCGSRTTVQALYRVDESCDGKHTPHLVFYDRHGWYCLHGVGCLAVGVAQKAFENA